MSRWGLVALVATTVLTTVLTGALTGGCGRTACSWCDEGLGNTGGADAADDDADGDGSGQTSVRRFVATRHLSLTDAADAVVLGNPENTAATVEVRIVPAGTRTPERLAPFDLPAHRALAIDLDLAATDSERSAVADGGIFILDTDRPLTAVQYAPATISDGNDTSLLSPTSALGTRYVVASYPGRTSISPPGAPSWADITALEQDTVVEWTPLIATTEGADGIPTIGPGDTGEVVLERWQTLRLTATGPDGPERADLSGTIVTTSAPAVVVSGTRCAQVPAVESYPPFAGCDPLLQQLVPVERWGDTYVAPRPARRNAERDHWRIYAGGHDVTVTTDPVQPGTPHTFDRAGEFIELELANATSFVFDADGPIQPVQYLQSAYLPEFDLTHGTAQGDAAMVHALPTTSFVASAIVYSPPGFDHSFIQVVRAIGGGVATIDGVELGGFEPIAGRFELAEIAVTPGSHHVEGDDPLGVIAIGYSDVATNTSCGGPCFSSYAHWAAMSP